MKQESFVPGDIPDMLKCMDRARTDNALSTTQKEKRIREVAMHAARIILAHAENLIQDIEA